MTTTRSYVREGAGTRRLQRTLVTLCTLTGFTTWAVGIAPAHALTAGPLPAVAAPALAQPHAAAGGKLTPRGCTAVAAVVTCDLYAKVTTTTYASTSGPITIWGFASDDVAPVTTPGPALVVNQGDHVTVTLHNKLPGESISLAFPGQNGSAVAPGDDRAGVSTGNTTSYSFDASRAGTFLYEAGHTGNGARQVAMGLAGAFVVLPAGGATAYGNQADYPDTSYNDDALLVLSEIDPALNKAPNAFDMRDWAPKYRLINGEAFPETKSIPTDQGHKVLVRYVNIGSDAHSMSVLGRQQVEVATDGHPSQYATTLATEAIDPGTTLDTIVTMPTGPESKIAVYEPSQHSDNNSQHTDDPEQLAFGGMIVMLDTNALPSSSDGVGPVTSHVAVSPNPATSTDTVTVTANLSDAKTGGHIVKQAEYVIDDTTTSPGFGTPMTVASQAVSTSASATIPLTDLKSGRHTIYVRAMDSVGVGNWGVVSSTIFTYAKDGPLTTNVQADANPANGKDSVDITATGDDRIARGTVTAAYYFVGDVDPGPANGLASTPMLINRTTSVVSMTATIAAPDMANLSEGKHTVSVRARDSHGTWGDPGTVDLLIDLHGPVVDSASVGPTPNNGLVSAKGNPDNVVIAAQITDNPSLTLTGVTSALDDAEAFIIDPTTPTTTPTPAEGSGIQLVAVDGDMDSSQEAVYGLIPLSHIRALANGVHQVWVRGHDIAGNWGPLFPVSFTVDKVAPILGAPSVTFSPDPGPAAAATFAATTATLKATLTESSGISAAEYWIGTTVPAVGKGTSTTWILNPATGAPPATVSLDINLANVPAGSQQFNMRVKDGAGNWSQPAFVSAFVVKPNAIFSDQFTFGVNAWSSRTGPFGMAQASSAAKALAVSFTLPNQRQASYVTDTTPFGEPTYHAKFTFKPAQLTSGNGNALTIFSARDITNQQVFSVQYRLFNGTPQVRAVLDLDAGKAQTRGWSTMTAAAGQASTIQVDWASGSDGLLKLSTSNASTSVPVVTQTLTGLNSTMRVDTVLLGVSAGVGGAARGTAMFDNFVSVRTSF